MAFCRKITIRKSFLFDLPQTTTIGLTVKFKDNFSFNKKNQQCNY
jgi:hypothetical protein